MSGRIRRRTLRGIVHGEGSDAVRWEFELQNDLLVAPRPATRLAGHAPPIASHHKLSGHDGTTEMFLISMTRQWFAGERL